MATAVQSIVAAIDSPISVTSVGPDTPEFAAKPILAVPTVQVDGVEHYGVYAALTAAYAAANHTEPAALLATAAALESAAVAAAAAHPEVFFIASDIIEPAVATVAGARAVPEAAELTAALDAALAASVDDVEAALRVSHIPHDRYFTLSPTPSHPVYVTTPIYYVNGEPHIGHAYSTLLADVYARWHKLRGHDTFFQTGLDEHGMKVERSAIARGIPPKEHCDSLVPAFLETFELYNLKYDRFIRTTDADHVAAAQEMWRRLAANGLIYKDKFSSWYNPSDENFLTEKETTLVVDAATGEETRVAADSGVPLIWIEEDNYLLRLSALAEPLLEFFEAHPNWIYPAFRQREMEQFVRRGLRDISVSRQKEKLSWGIPVPGDDDHVMYVWIDALTNYLTGSGWPAKEGQADWRWPAAVHVLGKDILRFHSIIWPAMLLGAGLPLPESMIAHGWWTRDHKKIGKSVGNALDPKELVAQYTLDPVRWFFLRSADASLDADYSDAEMSARLVADLANNFGNLVSRAVAPKMNIFGEIPTLADDAPVQDAERVLAARLGRLAGTVDHYLVGKPLDTRDAAAAIMATSSAVNAYTQAQAPWTLAKRAAEDPAAAARLRVVLHYICEGARILATLLLPFMPETAARALQWMGVPEDLWAVDYCTVGHGAGCKINAPEVAVLFTVPKTK